MLNINKIRNKGKIYDVANELNTKVIKLSYNINYTLGRKF